MWSGSTKHNVRARKSFEESRFEKRVLPMASSSQNDLKSFYALMKVQEFSSGLSC